MASSALLKAAAFAALLIGSAAAPCSGEHCVSDEVSLLQASAQVTKAAERQETEVQKEEKETGDMNEQELKAFRSSLGVTDDDFGSSDCPCIGINNVEGVIFGKVDQGDGMPDGVSFPADLGARCDAWDEQSTNPSCGHVSQSWCFQKWCYVDPCNCKGTAELPKPSEYLRDAEYKGHAIYFSYATCGAKDSYSKSDSDADRQKRIDESCSKKADEALWGKSDCKCTGFTPLDGVKQVLLDNSTVLEYVADYGSDCKAWDLDNDPACMEDDAPEYCVEKWCYVDASCKEDGVKTSSLMPDATVDGKPITYSYATCGGVDKYSN